jgi:asparagine synthase (glutamine-hydrolysing)
MCGLAGFLDRSGRMSADALESVTVRMNNAIRHRGPDDSGAWVDAESGIALGHRRLSIIDLSAEGHQPMHSESGRFVMVFNGEVYNFQEIRDELDAHGHRFRGHSDTEVMLASFEEWGVRSSLDRFNGMFAFAAWDRKNRELHLVRDRIGKKPLFYGWAGDSLLFGSELKAFHAHPSFNGRIDRNVLALYLRHGYIPAPHSIYEGIRKLPPGGLLTIRERDRGNNAEAEQYWSVLDAARHSLARPLTDAREAGEELERLLRDATGIRMVADVPLGAFLSGGIDSSVVVALMQSISSRPVKTFSIGFRESTHDEATHAKAVAAHLGTDHTELYVTPSEARDVIPRLPTMFDEPFADSSQIPTFLVSELARRSVTVALSGDGGDEFFSGYTTYVSCARQFEKYGDWPPALRRAAAQALTGIPAGVWDTVAGRFVSNAGARFRRLGSVLTHDAVGPAYRALVSHWEHPGQLAGGVCEPLTPFASPEYTNVAGGPIPSMMLIDAAVYLPDDILVKVDRASMAVSLEARCPILDYRVFEFAWRLPLELKRRNGEGKSILKDLAYKLVPRQLLDRPKSGFSVPIGEWLRGPLRPWAEELLDASRLRREGWLDADTVRHAWSTHLSGRIDWSTRLWTVLMFQTWLDHYDRALPPASKDSVWHHSAL